ncbi:uncharacterized protein LOC132601448 [Lycium barbarum]|uniref:uncharacterized protein LOC132601448 n=1 Tax=Lycium barbarum TaxID=112863 RepID=UPI00293E96C3|nr:uncharacterized protein LOC132601448 [Lycium barbarum]
MASIVEDLRITFGLRENHANEINEWIRFPMFKKVKSFDSLTLLSLNTVDVTNDTVTLILSNCPLLETLALKNTRSLWSLVVNGPSLKLKHLKIKHCFQLAVVEILAENLVSFKYLESLMDISFGNVPLLSEVSQECFSLIPAEFPEFSNLKHLELNFLEINDQSLAVLVSLLRACS